MFTLKWRRNVFTAAQLSSLNSIFSSVCTDFEAELAEFDGERNHVHLLVQYPPQVSLSKLINSLKGVSSRRLKVLHPEIRKHYWERHCRAGAISSAQSAALRLKY